MSNKHSAATLARVAPVVRKASVPVSGFDATPVSAPVQAVAVPVPVPAPTMSHEDMVAAFMALKAQNEALRAKVEAQAAKRERPITFKVSRKGAVSVYGLSRFPTTLYANQWEKVFAQIDAMRAFIRENEGKTVTGVDSQTGEAWSVVFHASKADE